ncbi:MAG: glycosyltransferase [Bergeyella sp.]
MSSHQNINNTNTKTPVGINVSGYINKIFGLGVAVRSNISAMKKVGLPYVINDFNLQFSDTVKEISLEDDKFTFENPYSINLVQINIDRLEEVFTDIDRNYFKDKYNIAFWAWELENFPEKAIPFFDFFQEIWVPSNFCAEAISKISPIPVIKIMHSIEIEKTDFGRKDFGLPEGKFIFLTMFDYYSYIERKNPIATIDAYEQSFGQNNADVLLVIKTSISNDFPKDKEKLLKRIGGNKSIILIEEILEKDQLYGLMNCCDSFVSLHRSEGFGLTMAEAMFLGKPVIATAYSANTEFMNINNSFLVKYSMVKTGDKYYCSTEKDFWANPDTDHAASLMKFVFDNPKEKKEIAQKGQEFVKTYLSPEAIGNKIKDRVTYIKKYLLSRNKDFSLELARINLEKKLLQDKIDKLKSYFPIKAKLAFKNFKNKITGKNRKYFWED